VANQSVSQEKERYNTQISIDVGTLRQNDHPSGATS
jgi:hypothetical protein